MAVFTEVRRLEAKVRHWGGLLTSESGEHVVDLP